MKTLLIGKLHPEAKEILKENFRHYFGTWWESLCTAHPRYDYTWLNLHRPWTGKGCNLKCETVRLKGTNFFVHADGNTIIMRYE